MSDYINRESVLNTIEDMDKILDTDRTVEEYKALLIECIKALPSRDSITEFEKIKEEVENMWIKGAKDLRTGEIIYENLCEHSEVLEILEKHIAELKGENE